MRIEIPDDIWSKLLELNDYSDFEKNLDSLTKVVEKSLIQKYGHTLPYTIELTKYDFVLGVIRSYFQPIKFLKQFNSLEPEKDKLVFDYAFCYLEKNLEQFHQGNIFHAFTIDEENIAFSLQRILDRLSYSEFRRLVVIASAILSIESKEICKRFINESKSFKMLRNVLLEEYADWFISELESQS